MIFFYAVLMSLSPLTLRAGFFATPQMVASTQDIFSSLRMLTAVQNIVVYADVEPYDAQVVTRIVCSDGFETSIEGRSTSFYRACDISAARCIASILNKKSCSDPIRYKYWLFDQPL